MTTKELNIKVPEGLHPDTIDLVQKTAEAMAAKLFKAQEKYGFTNGWRSAPDSTAPGDGRYFFTKEDNEIGLFTHLAKGDPIDCINYLAFALANGWPTRMPNLCGWAVVLTSDNKSYVSPSFYLQGEDFILSHRRYLYNTKDEALEVFNRMNTDASELSTFVKHKGGVQILFVVEFPDGV